MTEQLDPKALGAAHAAYNLGLEKGAFRFDAARFNLALRAYLAASQPPVDGDVVERVRLVLCKSLKVNQVTHSYKYLAEDAIAAAYPALLARIVELEGEREAGIVEAAGYHEELARFFEQQARDYQKEYRMGTADEAIKDAMRHRVYSKEIRAKVWRSSLSTTSKGSDVDE